MGLLWAARLALGAASALVYQRIYAPDWRNPALALYDLPTLFLASSFAAGAAARAAQGHPAAGAVELGALAASLGVGYGAAHAGWPVSGHLTVALTVGLLEARNAENPPWFRCAALVPALLLIAIRTGWPQSALMSNRANTLTACAAGLLLAGAAALLSGRFR